MLFLVARGGVEPPTFRFSVGRSYQLSYLAVCGEDTGPRERLRMDLQASGTVANDAAALAAVLTGR
jgi:hypothetical protein